MKKLEFKQWFEATRGFERPVRVRYRLFGPSGQFGGETEPYHRQILPGLASGIGANMRKQMYTKSGLEGPEPPPQNPFAKPDPDETLQFSAEIDMPEDVGVRTAQQNLELQVIDELKEKGYELDFDKMRSKRVPAPPGRLKVFFHVPRIDPRHRMVATPLAQANLGR